MRTGRARVSGVIASPSLHLRASRGTPALVFFGRRSDDQSRRRHAMTMTTTPLESTARMLVAPGRGILAADESHSTIEKRFAAIGVENTEEHRRVYRQMLFTTPGVAEFISGVILFDETIRQKSDDGTPFADLLARRGMIPGIKVDKGTKPLAGARGELITEGLDGLRERLAEYRGLGAR